MSDSGPTDDAALTRLAFELSLLARHFPAAVLRRPGFRLDRSAYLILTRLELDSPLSLRELSEAFRLGVSTINRQVGAMLKQGPVDRVPDPEGGIARKIRASTQGLELLSIAFLTDAG
ncbi:MarR family winged helix-turn-helix transcriptional regulator [Nocardia amamiensis]|uniref:MarR family winged helix-turn-helix transcriptional regulator n=1 Tax=Nocardia amamiensis TaxID=404578 RepID=UPI003401EB91